MSATMALPQQLSKNLSRVGIDRLPVRNFIPPEGEEFRWHNYVAIPAMGASAIVVQFQVPEGRNVVINRFSNEFSGGAFQPGTGQGIWQLYQDSKALTLPFPPSALVMPNFDNILASLGLVNNPAILNGLLAFDSQTVTLIFKNLTVVVAGQTIGGLLGGYYYPSDLAPATMAF